MDLEYELTLQQLQAVIGLMPSAPSDNLERQRQVLMECMNDMSHNLQVHDSPPPPWTEHAAKLLNALCPLSQAGPPGFRGPLAGGGASRPRTARGQAAAQRVVPVQTASPLAVVRADQAWVPTAKPAKPVRPASPSLAVRRWRLSCEC